MSSWQTVETRRDRRDRKRDHRHHQVQQRNKPDPKRAFVEHILKEYKNTKKGPSWKNTVESVVNEMWEASDRRGQRLNRNNTQHVKLVLQKVNEVEAEALINSYTKPVVAESKDPSEQSVEPDDEEEPNNAEAVEDEVEEEDELVGTAPQQSAEQPENEPQEPEEEPQEQEEEWVMAQPEQEDQAAEQEGGQEPEEEEAPEAEEAEEAPEADAEEAPEDEEEDEEEEEEEKPPPPTLTQILAEEAKSFNILTPEGVQMITDWTQQIRQDGEEGSKYRCEFYKSNVLKSIVKALLTEKPNEDIPGAEEVISLFHTILQGNEDYHRWLYNQIRKLADYISKTSKRTHPEWMQFLTTQAFAIVDAQKEPDRLQALVAEPQDFMLPTAAMFASDAQGQENLKLLGAAADTCCKDMHKTLRQLREKDAHLLSMNPTANSQFKERYTQVTGHLEQHIAKANAHVLAQQRNLEKINEQFRENERRSKDEVQPVEEQLRSVKHQVESSKQAVLELEARLKSERAKLTELNKVEAKLKSQIQKIKAQHHPPRADLTSQRNNCQFKLHSVHREQNCYTHLRHIAMESYKHLDSWSQCNISRESDTRRLCLKQYFDHTEKYVSTILRMLQFLGSRLQWMQKRLRQLEEHTAQSKQYFGQSGASPVEAECMDQIRSQMEADGKVVEKLRSEIDKALNIACSSACSHMFENQLTAMFMQYFNELWQKVSAVANSLKLNLNSFVKLKQAQTQQRHAGAMNGQQQHMGMQASQQGGHPGQQQAARQAHQGHHLMQSPQAPVQHAAPGRQVPQKLANVAGQAAPLKIVNDTPGGYQTPNGRGSMRPTKPPINGPRIPSNPAASGNPNPSAQAGQPQNAQPYRHSQGRGRRPPTQQRQPPQSHWNRV